MKLTSFTQSSLDHLSARREVGMAQSMSTPVEGVVLPISLARVYCAPEPSYAPPSMPPTPLLNAANLSTLSSID